MFNPSCVCFLGVEYRFVKEEETEGGVSAVLMGSRIRNQFACIRHQPVPLQRDPKLDPSCKDKRVFSPLSLCMCLCLLSHAHAAATRVLFLLACLFACVFVCFLYLVSSVCVFVSLSVYPVWSVCLFVFFSMSGK